MSEPSARSKRKSHMKRQGIASIRVTVDISKPYRDLARLYVRGIPSWGAGTKPIGVSVLHVREGRLPVDIRRKLNTNIRRTGLGISAVEGVLYLRLLSTRAKRKGER